MRGAREQNKRDVKVPRSRGSNNKLGRDEITGQRGCVSVKKDELALPICTVNGTREDPPKNIPDTKIKLQLFPVDEDTRVGLEKDGIHPYLELTFKPTKRISSVLKHINNKWASSKVALGEPMLLPYDIHTDISRSRTWTMKDTDARAGDVYAYIGRPPTFRLRYGWVLPPEPKTSEEPPTSVIPYEGCLQSEGAQKDEDDVQRADNQSGLSEAPWINEPPNVTGAFLSEASLQDKLNTGGEQRPTENNTDSQPAQTSNLRTMVSLWGDGLTDISIGGLFSEASLQGVFNNGNTAKSVPGNADSHSTQFFSDSLDAFISSQMRCPQAPKPLSHDSQTFILDGEETCHAFPIPKFSSSGKRISAISGSSGGFGHDSGSRSLKFPKIDEISTQAGVSEDLFLSPRAYNDENSLGLANIKWGDSLGPFDLGLSASRKLAKEENRQHL